MEQTAKATAEILDILAKNKCTVDEARTILRFAERTICETSTVPELNYLEEIIRLHRPC